MSAHAQPPEQPINVDFSVSPLEVDVDGQRGAGDMTGTLISGSIDYDLHLTSHDACGMASLAFQSSYSQVVLLSNGVGQATLDVVPPGVPLLANGSVLSQSVVVTVEFSDGGVMEKQFWRHFQVADGVYVELDEEQYLNLTAPVLTRPLPGGDVHSYRKGCTITLESGGFDMAAAEQNVVVAYQPELVAGGASQATTVVMGGGQEPVSTVGETDTGTALDESGADETAQENTVAPTHTDTGVD